MKLNAQLIGRFALCVVSATAYKIATLPLTVAGFFLVPFAIWFGVERPSKLTGQTIFTAPKYLELFGNEQDGYDPEWAVTTIYKGWPTFWRRYSWAAWRNSVRNLPFVSWLAWLHKPDFDALPVFDVRTIGGVRVELHWRGWMTELKATKGNWFLDIGPRLDQPSEWGGVSWAYRLNGRLP